MEIRKNQNFFYEKKRILKPKVSKNHASSGLSDA